MKKLINLSSIDSNRIEGKYLLAALAKLTTESQTDKTPDEVLEQCYILQEYMFRDTLNISLIMKTPLTFEKELEILINKYSKENDSNTPDFIIKDYLLKCLDTFNSTTNSREKWYGRSN